MGAKRGIQVFNRYPSTRACEINTGTQAAVYHIFETLTYEQLSIGN